MTSVVYSFDSSSLIHAWRRAYRPRNFVTFWRQMEQLVEEGRLKISIEVYGELSKKDDELFEWCKQRKDQIVVDIDDAVQTRMIELMASYPRLVDTASGKSGGDPWVIALASCGLPPSVVVTQETKSGKVRIPDVCDAESVPWCDLADFIEKEGWQL